MQRPDGRRMVRMSNQHKKWIDLGEHGLALWLVEDPAGEAPSLGVLESVDRDPGRLDGLIEGTQRWPDQARQRLQPTAIDPDRTRVELGRIDAGALRSLFPAARVMRMPRSAFTREPRTVELDARGQAGAANIAQVIAERSEVGEGRDQSELQANFERAHERLGFGRTHHDVRDLIPLATATWSEAQTALVLALDIRLADLNADGRGLFHRFVMRGIERTVTPGQPVVWALPPAVAESELGQALHDGRQKSLRLDSGERSETDHPAWGLLRDHGHPLADDGPRQLIATYSATDAEALSANDAGLATPTPVPADQMYVQSVGHEPNACLVRRGRLATVDELERKLSHDPPSAEDSPGNPLRNPGDYVGGTPAARARQHSHLTSRVEALKASDQATRASADAATRIHERKNLSDSLDELATGAALMTGRDPQAIASPELIAMLGRDQGERVREVINGLQTSAGQDAAEALHRQAQAWRQEPDSMPASENERNALLATIVADAARPLPATLLRNAPADTDTNQWLANKIAALAPKIPDELMPNEAAKSAREDVYAVIHETLASRRDAARGDEHAMANDRLSQRAPGERRQRHDDAGEVLVGAAKHRWQGAIKTSDFDRMNADQASDEVTKDNCWPKPDWQAWHDAGVPITPIVLLKKLRDELPRRPVKAHYRGNRQYSETDPDRVRRFVSALESLNGLTEEWMAWLRDDETLRARFDAGQSEPDNALRDAAAPLLQEITEILYSADRGEKRDDGQQPCWLMPVPRQFCKRWLGSLRESPAWMEAVRTAIHYGSEALSTRQKRSGPRWQTPRAPRLERVSRHGPDYRQGRHVTGDDLVEVFGFRGIQFGDWLPHTERGEVLDHAYDGLMDLADALGIAPSTMGFEGAIGLAFGARGKGNAAAHYEHTHRVINLTRMSGAGSLAHEWFHALDHYARMLHDQHGSSRIRDGETPLLSDCLGEQYRRIKAKFAAVRLNAVAAADLEQPATDRFSDVSGPMALPTTLRALTHNAIFDPQRRGPGGEWKASSLREQCSSLDRKNHGYWSRPSEMLARAFEATVYDYLCEHERQSDYLVAGVQDGQFSDHRLFKADPVASGEDRKRLRAVYDAMIGHAMPAFENHLAQQTNPDDEQAVNMSAGR